VVLIALTIFSWDVGRPGLWRDEAATIVACRRSLAQVFQLSGNVDLVHLPYYLLARLGWQLNDSVTTVRWVSVLTMSLAAGMLVPIGRRLGSVRIGVLAGLLLAVNPFATRYAPGGSAVRHRRPAVRDRHLPAAAMLAEPSRRIQLGYATALILLGLFNVLALLLVLPHAVQVWWTGDRSAPAPMGGGGCRALVVLDTVRAGHLHPARPGVLDRAPARVRPA
jgi:mannosyltransferase